MEKIQKEDILIITSTYGHDFIDVTNRKITDVLIKENYEKIGKL